MTATAGAPTYRSLLAVPEFRVLLGGFVLFGTGFQLEILGLSVLVYARTSSPLLSAVSFGVGFLPQLVGGALLTSLADRLRPRSAIALGLLVRGAPGLVIGILPALPVGAMLGLVAASAATSPVVSAATLGLLPELLEGERYVLGRSVFNFVMSGTQLLGLALGGVVLALVPPADLLLASGAALVAAAAVTRAGLHHRPPRAPAGHGRRVGVVRATVHGNLALLVDPHVRGLLLAMWLPVWCVTGAESLLVAYVGASGAPASAASVVLAPLPIGMLVGNVVLGRCVREPVRRRLTLPLALATGLPLLGFALTPALGVAVVLLGLTGLALGYVLGLQQPFLDSVPVARRGQAFGLNSTGTMGGQGLTPLLFGAVATVVTVGPAIALAGLASTGAALALRRTLRGRAAAARFAEQRSTEELLHRGDDG